MLGRQSAAGVPSAGDYEQIVVILRRHPNHFPDLAYRKIPSTCRQIEIPGSKPVGVTPSYAQLYTAVPADSVT